MKSINKNLFLKTLECPVYAWHLYRELIPKDSSLSDDFLVMESSNIHNRAKLLFKDGIQVSKKLEEALQQTKDLINDNSIKTIFEPVFKYDGFIAKADILSRTDTNSWEIIEVKSGNKWKHKYISDIAYVSMIATKTSSQISKATLYLLSKDFRLGKTIDEMFTKIDCSFDVFAIAEEYSKKINYSKEILLADKPEEKKLKISCKNCALFKECTGKDIEYHIFDLPRLSQSIFEKLVENKIYEIKDIPKDIELTQMQEVVKDCVVNDKIFISENLRKELDKIVFPAYYLDFESVMTIYPLYNNIAPHSQILTQYSIHKCDKVGNIIDHFEYIADHTQDCRKIIAKKLVEILQTTGSIVTYSSFEKQIIEKLMTICPELTEQLKAIINRIVDLEEILRLNYYDKRFHGKTSIKKILPIMIPQMNYDKLEIGEGGVALSAFAYMAMGLYSEEKIKETKQNLLKYCKQDTLALVKMHRFLYDVADIIHPFNNNVNFENEDTLIIGTFPARRTLWSFEFFYSSKHNKLWNILQEIFNENFKFKEEQEAVEERKKFLKDKNLAMIDIIEECVRKKQKSSDNNLQIIALRDIYSILKNNKKIKRIILTSSCVLSLLKKELDENYLQNNKIELKFKNFDRNIFEFKELKSIEITKEAYLKKAVIHIKNENRKIDVFIPYSPSPRCFNKYKKNIIVDMYKQSLENFS